MTIQSSTAKVAMSAINSKPDFMQYGIKMASAIETAVFPLLGNEPRKLILDDYIICYKEEKIVLLYHVEGCEEPQEDECSFDELAAFLVAKGYTSWCRDSSDHEGNHIQITGDDDPYDMIKDPQFSASFILQSFINHRGY